MTTFGRRVHAGFYRKRCVAGFGRVANHPVTGDWFPGRDPYVLVRTKRGGDGE